MYKKCNFFIILCICIVMFITACASVKKKFTRKRKKENPKTEIIAQLKDYNQTLDNDDEYKNNYIYWRSWHKEAINTVGKQNKRALYCIDEAIENLNIMKDLIVAGRNEIFMLYLKELKKIRTNMQSRVNLTNKDIKNIKRELKRLYNEMERKIKYKKINQWIK